MSELPKRGDYLVEAFHLSLFPLPHTHTPELSETVEDRHKHYNWRESYQHNQLVLVKSSMSAPTSIILVSLEVFAALAMFSTSKSKAILLTRPSSIC